MMRELVLICCAALLLASCNASAPDDNSPDPSAEGEAPVGKQWVTAERISRHTCPSEKCGVVGTFDFRQGVDVEEVREGWARVSRFYDASCVGGRSEYVDKGDATCLPANGIKDGKFAEWVRQADLSEVRPPDPAATANEAEQAIKDSDDFLRYRESFTKAASELVTSGQCTSADLAEYGGFVKSANQPDEPIYFTYCGGDSVANRIYLNAETGAVFR